MDLTHFQGRGLVAKPVDNQSVPAGQTYNSASIITAAVKRVRIWYKTKGTLSSAKLQGSFDGTTWYDIDTLNGGVNAIEEIAEPYVRITVTNSGGTAETNEVWIFLQI